MISLLTRAMEAFHTLSTQSDDFYKMPFILQEPFTVSEIKTPELLDDC